MGTPAAAVPTLERIIEDGHDVVAVWTQPDRPAGRGNKLAAPPVKEFALERGLSVYQPLKMKTPESLEMFRSHRADVAVVVAYGRILSESYLTAFPRGCINVHFSLLPKYRGAAPVNWVIVNGETMTGVTTMQMDAGLDTGDILLQLETEIGCDESSTELMSRLSVMGADLLSETLHKLDTLIPIAQDNSQATFAPIMKKEDGLIDWGMPAEQIRNRARGFQPFPSAYTFYQGKRLVISKADAGITDAVISPGCVIEAKGDQIKVACGKNTALFIKELQIEGKRRMSARDLLNGIKMQPGDKLG